MSVNDSSLYKYKVCANILTGGFPRKAAPNDSGVLENSYCQTFHSKFPTL